MDALLQQRAHLLEEGRTAQRHFQPVAGDAGAGIEYQGRDYRELQSLRVSFGARTLDLHEGVAAYFVTEDEEESTIVGIINKAFVSVNKGPKSYLLEVYWLYKPDDLGRDVQWAGVDQKWACLDSTVYMSDHCDYVKAASAIRVVPLHWLASGFAVRPNITSEQVRTVGNNPTTCVRVPPWMLRTGHVWCVCVCR